ncbi:MAG: UDP-N-acetylmuramoylalanine--D-glutamate ligase [Parcubacteria group bacterium Gr01-1014_70]|nr:MAG: UDP-N-acetylmuramoylalanine--D-glutamate ligase [Parcubacteria group bacterium Gr01-1014_70]
MDWKQFFKSKKVTLMGLGLLGRGVGDAIFLAECGADLIVTDLRDTKTLAPSLAKLKRFRNINYTLSEHKLEDFRNRNFILKAAGVPLDSPFITEALKNNIQIEMDASLFARLLTPERSDGGQAKLAPVGVTIVGITGTRGKSTTTALIYEILKRAKKKVYKGGNLVPEATLPLMKKVRAGDIVVLELDSWQLQGFHDAKISPHVAVFTTFLDDHLSYYKNNRDIYFSDKTAIFKYQKSGDVLVVGEQAASFISSKTAIIARSADIPKGWKIKLLGEHNRENISCAVAAARALGISDAVIKKVVENFDGLPNRLEYLRTIRGIKIYNDNNATTPDATVAGLKALGTRQNIILICGGTDKGLDMSKLVEEIPKHCKTVVLLKESGTEKLLSEFPLMKGGATRLRVGDVFVKETLKECVKEAMNTAKKGDIILFSPAFASFGKWFKNEYDRGEQFVVLVKKLK